MTHAQPHAPLLLDAESAPPGVTRFDLICGPGVADTVLELVCCWVRDRALSDSARQRLTVLMRSALTHGLRFEPRGLTILVRWVDIEHVRFDVRWHGGSESAKPDEEGQDVGAAVATLDSVATEWGLGRTRDGWVQWVVAGAS